MVSGSNMPALDGLDFTPGVPAGVTVPDVYHQLVILGNGFDLHCGLKSGFGDFFAPRVELAEGAKLLQGDKLEEYMHANGLTAWDLILATRRNLVDWCDVEKAIAEVVCDARRPIEETEGIRCGSRVTSYSIAECLYDNKRVEPDSSFDDVRGHIFSAFNYSESDQIIADYLMEAYGNVAEWDISAVLKCLLEELHGLEREFSSYMLNAIDECPSYEDTAARLLADIGMRDMPLEGDLTQTTILNFNYTRPSFGLLQCDEKSMSNVHGMLGNEIVFGIDGTKHMADEGIIEFTKTYRLMNLGTVGFGLPVAYEPQDYGIGRANTLAIKFYGHSLAEADYSYFQSIFDIVDLYGGITSLYFYYSSFKDGVVEDVQKSVTKLLSTYGRTMDNKKHGRNLIHKLLLEGRLHIAEI